MRSERGAVSNRVAVSQGSNPGAGLEEFQRRKHGWSVVAQVWRNGGVLVWRAQCGCARHCGTAVVGSDVALLRLPWAPSTTTVAQITISSSEPCTSRSRRSVTRGEYVDWTNVVDSFHTSRSGVVSG